MALSSPACGQHVAQQLAAFLGKPHEFGHHPHAVVIDQPQQILSDEFLRRMNECVPLSVENVDVVVAVVTHVRDGYLGPLLGFGLTHFAALGECMKLLGDTGRRLGYRPHAPTAFGQHLVIERIEA